MFCCLDLQFVAERTAPSALAVDLLRDEHCGGVLGGGNDSFLQREPRGRRRRLHHVSYSSLLSVLKPYAQRPASCLWKSSTSLTWSASTSEPFIRLQMRRSARNMSHGGCRSRTFEKSRPAALPSLGVSVHLFEARIALKHGSLSLTVISNRPHTLTFIMLSSTELQYTSSRDKSRYPSWHSFNHCSNLHI